jgi:hypothetical protein
VRDLSDSGLCLEVEQGLPIGSLLRVTLRGIDGRPALDALGRVTWCRAEAEGHHVGVTLLEPHEAEARGAGPRPVRPRDLPRA